MRRRPVDAGRPPKRPTAKRSSDQGPGFLLYTKVFAAWAAILFLDHLFELRIELLYPLVSLWRSVMYINRVDGAVMIGLFLGVTFVVDWLCLWFVPIHWLFFIGSVHIWVQMLWQTDSDLYIATILLFVCFVYVEAIIRLHVFPAVYIHKLLAAHCLGSPLIMLALDLKELLKFQLRKRRRKDVESDNRFFSHLAEGSLPRPMRIQCNDYSQEERGDAKSTPSKTLSLATAQDLEAQSQNHSGFFLWVLRLLFRHVSGWLDTSDSGGSGGSGGSGDGSDHPDDGHACANDRTPGKDNSGSAPESLGGIHNNAHTAHSESSTTVTHRRRHDSKDSSGKSSSHTSGAGQTGKAAKAVGDSQASYGHHQHHQQTNSLPHAAANGSVANVPPGSSFAGGGGGSGGLGNGASYSADQGVAPSRQSYTPETSRNPVTRVTAGSSESKKMVSGQSPVATVNPVASATVQPVPASRKESRLQQELSQLKSKWIVSREREDRLSDQVDALRDGKRKVLQDLQDSQQELKEVREEMDTFRRQLMNANEMNGMLQRECDSKADQVAAARQAHDTAENELREFTRKVAVDSSSLHQACRSTQHSLQRECQRQNQTIRQLEQQVSGEKSRCQMAIMDMEKYKVECVKLERKLGNELREKMEIIAARRDMRKQLDQKLLECRRLEQQVTEAMAVMPMQFIPTSDAAESAFESYNVLGSMDDFSDRAMKFGSLMASGEGEEDIWAPQDFSPPSPHLHRNGLVDQE